MLQQRRLQKCIGSVDGCCSYYLLFGLRPWLLESRDYASRLEMRQYNQLRGILSAGQYVAEARMEQPGLRNRVSSSAERWTVLSAGPEAKYNRTRPSCTAPFLLVAIGILNWCKSVRVP
ncbi:hypothetical protein Y1Q_0000246 [Alligator mississippiensis]|uniref:Uncharacterized protein n=1 Tax=Alligator mississippiensis TaxID=8496 RepID=A0A151P0A6_ALLMI|nr:hypothetical protein Y1Q_0000246 [Alligator mississippiensis]